MVAILFGYFEVQALCFKDPYPTSNKQHGNVRNSNTAILKLHLSNPKMFRIDPKWWSPFYLVISMLKLTSPQRFSWNLAQVFSCEFCEISKNTSGRLPLKYLQELFSRTTSRSSHPDLICRKSVLTHFAKFTGKQLYQMFSCENCEIFKSIYFEELGERLLLFLQ